MKRTTTVKLERTTFGSYEHLPPKGEAWGDEGMWGLCGDELQQWVDLPDPPPESIKVSVTPDELDGWRQVDKPEPEGYEDCDELLVYDFENLPRVLYVDENLVQWIDSECNRWNVSRLYWRITWEN